MRASALLFPALLLPGLLSGCHTNYAELPTFSAERKLLQVVVAMPAGTNHEQHYNPATHTFERQQEAGTEEVIEFLPVPGNLGFVPGTRVATGMGGAEAPLAALVLAETQPAGTVVEVTPLALLTLDVKGALQTVLLAVPARPAQRTLPDATDWATLNQHYPGVRPSLSLWFQHRYRPAETRIVGWKNEKEAEKFLRSHLE
ncbi:inorganic diphosphatase [Hymenobacter metallilatus]|uniref:inorganic diphosphatase n=1 Tax=Hymenobacter metallilatus TaxID=2493666 RepID=A0A3R9N0M3_9BACT|nr:inorganic diphosphatase [Hymenobacter metallilatus]RSK35464.1 inorganic diphosphatase [Hymenobacter metallilatus]